MDVEAQDEGVLIKLIVSPGAAPPAWGSASESHR